jgi:hypothetical protein
MRHAVGQVRARAERAPENPRAAPHSADSAGPWPTVAPPKGTRISYPPKSDSSTGGDTGTTPDTGTPSDTGTTVDTGVRDTGTDARDSSTTTDSGSDSAADTGTTDSSTDSSTSDAADGSSALVGETCANAATITLTNGTATLTAQSTANYANDYVGAERCIGLLGRDRVYKVAVPAGPYVSVTASNPDGTSEIGVNLVATLASCMSPNPSCRSGNDRAGRFDSADPPPQIENVAYHNVTNASQGVFIIADYGYAIDDVEEPDLGQTFDLTVDVGTPVGGDSCHNAVPLTSGQAMAAQTTTGFGNDYSNDTVYDQAPTGCSGTAGRDKVYSITVPAGQTLSATVTPTGANAATFDPAINIVLGPASACDAAPFTCLASGDDGGDGAPDTATWANTTGAAQTVFVIVDTYFRSGEMDFDVIATVAPTPN